MPAPRSRSTRGSSFIIKGEGLRCRPVTQRLAESGRGGLLLLTYSLSENGKSLQALTDSLAEWGLQHRARIMQAAN